ncbi:T9SS type B sorting domain-containing protein [Halpernia frigidisoli]|uniref:Gliding motility-associated C-terminal domain-containing protein n=1 Tax=Halpernia frigidisoli TaxID=1125876 RepID=A0A1I3DMU3_9FLAO|nr:T9SS type B sorting domain-containing protein [Halpernia frigidisoli]SFH87993.1 gliding motility-associated C-terminal domain-containing protein [Halpernia frigidisoli]
MKKLYLLFLLISFHNFYSQKQNNDTINYLRNGIFEDASGKMITSERAKSAFLKERAKKVLSEMSSMQKASQTAVEMCTNGGFEQTENISGNNVVKNFLYNIGDPPGPTQCKSITNKADTYIPQYNPVSTSVMATSVPANVFDKYMGDIKGFDQYALKINYQNSGTYGSIVQGKRFKTNNENFLKFNYKAVLQSVYDSSHTDNQAFFKARILDKNGKVISEFCLVGDEKNCIFTKVPDGSSGYVTLYTANWQSGILDISSIPNNEEFTVEFMASRCGLGGHFGYAYVDDICLLHSTENFVGSVNIDPLFAVCPTLPVNISGTYTTPNSGGVTATLKTLTLKLLDSNGTVVYTASTPFSTDPVTKKFIFQLAAANFPNTSLSNYNVSVTADFDIAGTPTGCNSAGTAAAFASATDSDANDGWDISFLNCSSSCDIVVKPAKISKCDLNHDGNESFNLADFDAKIVNSTTGLTFSYFKDYNSAFNNTGNITSFAAYNSPSAVIYVRVTKDPGCYKIIPVNLEVKNPTATISGILNVCSGSTELKASSGATYLWSTNETTQNITVTDVGIYSVTVTDSYGCASTVSVSIEPSQTAVTPTLEITQPSCFSSYGTIKVTSVASQYSFDNGVTWVSNPVKSNLSPGNYSVLIKTLKGCTSYPQLVSIVPALTSYPYYTATQPKFCGDTGTISITSDGAYFSFDNGLTWVTYSTINNLQPGLYTIRTKNVAGCISNPQNVYISSATLGNPDFTVVQPACTVAGKITINTPSDFYTFDGGQTWGTSNVLSNVFTGNFSVGIKNTLGCISYFQSIYLQPFENSYPDADVIQPVCGENGSIYIKTEADFYSFDNGVTWTTSNLKDLPAGTYKIKLKNAVGCVSNSNTVTLYAPRLDYPIFSVIQPICGANGKITINSVSDFYSFDDGVTWVTTNSMSLPAGTYRIAIKNALGCRSDANYVTLYQPTIPKPDVTSVQGTCTTKSSITINTPAAFYSIDGGYTWSTSNIFNNLTNNYYNAMIKNSLGCISESTNVSFTGIYLPSPAYTVVNPSCGNIGSITFSTTADFYSIDYGRTWSTSPVFTNLIEGSYGLTVKNTTGCKSDVIYISMSKTNLAAPTFTVIQPSCGVNGSITITSAGTSFSFDNGYTWSTSATSSNLLSGYYYILVKNGTCVSDYTPVQILPYYLPDATFTYTQPTCGVGGSITITTTADKYSIDGGYTWSTSPIFNNLQAGNFRIVVSNLQGCKSNPYNQYISLVKYYLPNPDVLIEQPVCGKNGSIKILNAGFEYSFDAGRTFSSVNEKNNLPSGSYQIVIKNAQGCTSDPYSVNIYLKPFFLPRPFIKVEQPYCGSGGSITIVSQSAQYSFDNGVTWGTNPVLLNPAPGYYNILIKNATGCISQTASAGINRYFLQQPVYTVIQPTCASPAGTIIINSIADQYSFDNGVTWSTSNVKNNLTSGFYYILIKNASGCKSSAIAPYINQAQSIPAAPAYTSTQPSACDATDGSITITTPAVSYSFNDGASWTTNPVKKNIGSGTYIIKLKTNSSSCESLSVPVSLNSGVNIPAPVISVKQPTCSVATGSITVTTVAATYSFDDGLTFVYSNTKTGLNPGTYKIKIKNATGCLSDVISAVVTTQAPLPAPSFSITQPNCAVSLGSIAITTAASEYSFDNGITYGISNIKNNAAPGTYNLMVKDAAGCISLAGTANVDQQPSTPAPPQISVSNPATCTSSTGNIAVISAAAFYSYDDGVTWISSPSATLSPGTYMVRIKLSANGCPSSATSATVDVPPNAPAMPTYNVVQPTSCVSPFGNISVSSVQDKYSFDNGVTYTSSSTSGPLLPGMYLIKVKNAAGCESGVVSATIIQPLDTPLKPTFQVQQIDCTHSSAKITINEMATEYSIDNGLTWQNSNIFNNLLPKTYDVKTKNSTGCISIPTTATVAVFVNPTPKPRVQASQNFCVQQNATVGSIDTNGKSLSWYDAPVGGNLLTSTTKLIDGQSYYATQTINVCESERVPVTINIVATSPPSGTASQVFCISQRATLGEISINGSQIQWYSSLTGNSVLPLITLLQDNVTYYASQTTQYCESLQRLPVSVSLVTSTIPAKDVTASPLCSDENGNLKTDLTKYESDIVVSASQYSYRFYDQNNNLISDAKNYILNTGLNNLFVEVNSAAGCSAKVELNIFVNAAPKISTQLLIEFCQDDFATLDAGSQPSENTYTWIFGGKIISTQQIINVKDAGIYKLMVGSSKGCVTERSITVKKLDLPVITSILIENSTVQIKAKGAGILEYSINGSVWQPSNTFYNVAVGTYTAFVRSGTQPCAVAEEQFTIFKIVNIFSPDGDGINDTWKIDGIEKYPGTKIKVLDRYGVTVLETTVKGNFSWNGEHLKRKLSTGSYWYQIIISDGRIMTGYVAIKNRN